MALRRLSLGRLHLNRSTKQALLQTLSSRAEQLASATLSDQRLDRGEDKAEAHSHPQTPCSVLSSLPRSSLTTSQPSSRHIAAHNYKVHIVTGNLRGAGSNCQIAVKLVGTLGQSDEFVIERDEGFERGHVDTVVLPVQQDLGPIKMVYVRRAKSGVSDPGAGWFLEKMLVDGPGGEEWTFPCMQWFGASTCGDFNGPLERHLVLASVESDDSKVLHPRPVKVVASAMAIPHPDKLKTGLKGINNVCKGKGGEDSYFYKHGQNSIFGMGVADGVHAARGPDYDSGVFSSTLMERACEMVGRGHDDVFKVLKTISRYVETEGVFGSSTCCLLTINKSQGLLNSANIGDSGFLVVGNRANKPQMHVVFRTHQQEHAFGWPFALGHHKYAVKPTDAMMTSFQVLPGDTVIMGSDGLFDNVYISDIVKTVEHCRQGGKGPQVLVQKLTELAHVSSLDKDEETPYSRAYSEAFDLSMSGGKPDDITIMAAYLS